MVAKAPPSAGVSTPPQSRPPLAALPAVDRLLREPALAALGEVLGHAVVKRSIRDELAALRERLARGDETPAAAALAAAVADRAQRQCASRLATVINLTGTVIHTNLGRALLADEAIASVAAAMRGYCALEYDLAGGDRGDRDAVVEDLLRDLTGAAAVTVVNNNAGAVLLSLAALAGRREAVISHGELIEIGGAFRMPDIMRAAQCRLVAVGTTNRTHPRDYADAITAKTGIVVRAHWSNYAISGFTSVVDEATIASIAHARGVPFLVDLGAGALVDLARFGLPREPLPADSLAALADAVTFSGDKLLGGPQAGSVLGSRGAITKFKRIRLKRALRCWKRTPAAVEATLRIYASDHRRAERLPVLALLSRPAADIRAACERVQPVVARFAGDGYDVRIDDCASQIGSGSLPVDRLPSAAIVVAPSAASRRGRALARLAERLRALPTPVVGRIFQDALWLDLRCLRGADEARLVAELEAAR